MKIKHTILIFVIGFLITLIGTLFKITHWHFGWLSENVLLTVGMILEITGGLLFLYKLFTRDKSKNFFNS